MRLVARAISKTELVTDSPEHVTMSSGQWAVKVS